MTRKIEIDTTPSDLFEQLIKENALEFAEATNIPAFAKTVLETFFAKNKVLLANRVIDGVYCFRIIGNEFVHFVDVYENDKCYIICNDDHSIAIDVNDFIIDTMVSEGLIKEDETIDAYGFCNMIDMEKEEIKVPKEKNNQ